MVSAPMNVGGAGARFITGIGHDKRTLGAGERQNRLVQGSAGTRVDPHVIRLDAFLLGEELLHAVAFAVTVASAVLDHSGRGFTRFLARSQRVLIGIEKHGVRGRVDFRKLRQGRLVDRTEASLRR